MVQEEMLFKDISYLELWQPHCSVNWNHLSNFGRHHEEQPLQSCEIILNLTLAKNNQLFYNFCAAFKASQKLRKS